MISKIDFISPHKSQYQVLHHFTQKLYEAWVRAGYHARYFDTVDSAMKEALINPPDLVMGFNGMPYHDGKFYSDIIKKPFLTLLVDPFFHFLSAILDPYVITACDDFSGYVYLKKLNFSNVLFIPHAVEADLFTYPSTEKVYDVVMLSTFIDHEALRKKWKADFPKPLCNVMDRIIEMTFNDPQMPFVDATLEKMQSFYNEYPALNSKKIDTVKILKNIELYIKGKERVDLLKAIHHTDVHVFGQSIDNMNWRKYFKKQKNIIVHDSIPFERCLQIMQQSKIILNGSIKNKFGAHERIFSGLAAGALVVTNENPYLKKYFAHDVDIAFFQYPNLTNLPEIIESYLTDESKRQEIVENGQEIIKNFHTWDVRVKTMEEELFPLAEKIR